MSSPTARRTNPLWTIVSRYLRPFTGRVILLGAFTSADIACDLAMPYLLARFVDAVIENAPLGDLGMLAVGFASVAFLGQLITAAFVTLAEDLGMRATNLVRADVLSKVLSLDTAWHNTHTAGELIERIDGDTAHLNTLLSDMLPKLTSRALLLVAVIVAFFVVDLRIGVASVIFVPLVFFTLYRLQQPNERLFDAERSRSAHLFGLIEERLGGVEDIRANGAVRYTVNRLLIASRDWAKAASRARLAVGIAWGAPSVAFSGFLVLILAIGAGLLGGAAVSIGSLLLLKQLSNLMSFPLTEIGQKISDLLEATASAKRLDSLLRLQTSVVDSGDRQLPAGALSVQFKNVEFYYPDGAAPVLSDVSFAVPPGGVLGVLGRTGSGKSTLSRLVCRLYDVSSGCIEINGIPVAEVSRGSLRKAITLVTQDVQIFSASVRDNVALFDPALSDAAVIAAIEAVGLRGWLDALPAGLATLLGSGGASLSAGQAQLLALARAFTRDPGLVILDEASSRLDPATEAQLEHAITRLLIGRTAIVIAHRLKTVERADHIAIFEEGRLVEFGARASLAADAASRYAALIASDDEDEHSAQRVYTTEVAPL